jgi:multidrug efflux pump subunit AcrA (membrane-fusion protein)
VSVTRRSRFPRLLATGLALVASGLVFSACNEVPGNLVESQPYELEPIKGSDIQRVKLPDEIARNIDLQTATVRGDGNQVVVPHAALIYNPDGEVFVYTKPEPQTYVRAAVKVSRVVGDRAELSDGPPSGTEVVTVGPAELLATEYEIGNQHP